MNPYLQIAVGLLAGAAGLFVLFVRRKPEGAGPLALLCVLWAFTAFLAGQGMAAAFSSGGYDADIDYDKAIAAQMIYEGHYDKAAELLHKLAARDASDPEIVLAYARLKALQGLSSDSALLYEKARLLYEANGRPDFPQNEYDALRSLRTARTSGDAALMQYLSAAGADLEEYGISPTAYTREDAAAFQADGVTRIIRNLRDEIAALRDREGEAENVSLAAELVVSAQTLYEQQRILGIVPPEELSRLKRRLRTLEEEHPQLLENEQVRLARLRIQVMDSAYSSIAQAADGTSGSDELMILSELYIKGLVRPSHFDDNFAGVDDEIYDAVIGQCEKAAEALSEESRQVRNTYNAKIDALRKERRHKVLSEIKHQLADAAEDGTGEDASKLYLQLSKIEHYLDNPVQADQYMNLSIDRIGDSEDMSFAAPMHEIVGIITGDDDSETIKNVSEYVEQVTANALPIQIVEEAQLQENEDDEAGDFDQYLTNYISKRRAVINIGAIDISEFPRVSARIQVDSDAAYNAEQLLELLEVYDCGLPIEDFTLEKLDFSVSRVMLLCDVSGSMSSNVQDLKTAVEQFARSAGRDEELSLVGFDNAIRFHVGFTSNMEEILEASNQLGAFGGTNMYDALLNTMGSFPAQLTANNVVILMTDGQDNTKRSAADIKSNIGKMAQQNSITIYAIGLGNDVDTSYLSTIASSGGGKFLYVQDAESLEEFYSFIHNQLTNQYILTFDAKNTTDLFRELMVSLPDSGASDRREYSLIDTDELYGDDWEELVSGGEGLVIHGFDTKFLYKSDADLSVNLKGSGFAKDDGAAVELKGNLSYKLKTEYVDAETVKVTIPGGIAVGTYDAVVSTKESSKTFYSELTIAVPGKESTVSVGPYVFTALQKINNADGGVTMRGNVTMNGWLNFRGDVEFSRGIHSTEMSLGFESGFVDASGSYEKENFRVQVRDYSGAYISWNPASSKGLAAFLGERGISVPILPLGLFTLYNDIENHYSYDDYMTDNILTQSMSLYCLVPQNGSMRLYPDRINFNFVEAELDFPGLKTLIKAAGYNPFTFSAELSGVITHQNIGLVGEFSYGQGQIDTKKKVFSIAGKFPLGMKSIKLNLDTLKNDYGFKMIVFLEAFKNMDDNSDSFGLEFAVKGMKPDKLMLYVDTSFTPVRTPVPITFSSFGLGLTDMSDKMDNENYNVLLDSFITGQFDLSVAKLEAFVPKNIAKWLGNPALMTMADAKPKIRLREFSFQFDADLKLLDLLKIGYVEVKLGNFEYENVLLDLRSRDVFGIYFKQGSGIFWESKNINVDASISTEYTLTNRYIGFWGSGGMTTTINWWRFSANMKTSGDLIVAVYENNSGKPQFTLLLKDLNVWGKDRTRRVDITEGSKTYKKL